MSSSVGVRPVKRDRPVASASHTRSTRSLGRRDGGGNNPSLDEHPPPPWVLGGTKGERGFSPRKTEGRRVLVTRIAASVSAIALCLGGVAFPAHADDQLGIDQIVAAAASATKSAAPGATGASKSVEATATGIVSTAGEGAARVVIPSDPSAAVQLTTETGQLISIDLPNQSALSDAEVLGGYSIYRDLLRSNAISVEALQSGSVRASD